MMKTWIKLSLVFLCASAFTLKGEELKLTTKYLRTGISDSGQLTEITDTQSNKNYLKAGMPSYLVQIKMLGSGKFITPKSFAWKKTGSVIKAEVKFTNGVTAHLDIIPKSEYITMELKGISSDKVEMFFWGPYYSSLVETIGQFAGIAYNKSFAFALKPMNIKVVGGTSERLFLPMTAGAPMVTKGKNNSSVFSAHTVNASLKRVIDTAGLKQIPAGPIPGMTLVGSKVAIMGMPSKSIMAVMERFVKAEKLPYPVYKGEWAKTAYAATRPKMIIPYGVDNVDKCIEMAKAGSFLFVYHKAAFESNGHYQPRKDCFPEGVKSMKECADKIRAAGLIPGVHNMTTFIDRNDPYITPVPDKRLAHAGATTIATAINEKSRNITLAGDAPAAVYLEPGSGKAAPKNAKNKKSKEPAKIIRVENEIIRYRTSEKKNGKIVLIDCARGYWGTKATSHDAGAEIERLATHKRPVLFGDYDLTMEVADNLGKTIGTAGMGITSSDGLEGAMFSGYMFAMNAFTDRVYSYIKDHSLFYESSRPAGYFWYINTQQSWGEPHAAGFRHTKEYYDAKIIGRIKNSLIPSFIQYRLGQYSFHKLSRITDIEWLMTKCAGLGGGFDLYITPEEYEASGDFGPKVMETISLWEEARRKGIFTPEQRKDMEKFETVYRLTKNADGSFKVRKLSAEEGKEVIDPVLSNGTSVHLPKISKTASINKSILPPGLAKNATILPDMRHHVDHIEPGGNSNTVWVFRNIKGKEQPFRCVIRVEPGAKKGIKNPEFVLNEVNTVKIPLTLNPGEYIICIGNGNAVLFDKKGKKVKSVKIPAPKILGGAPKTKNTLSFNHYRGPGGEELGPDVLVNILIK